MKYPKKHIEVYFNNNSKARKILDRLVRWNPDKSLKENSEIIGMSYDNAKGFCRCYKLKVKKNIYNIIQKLCIKCQDPVPEGRLCGFCRAEWKF